MISAMHLLQQIQLKSGPVGISNPLEFKPATVNLFVGPNNSGKSLFLREIAQFINNGQISQAFLVLKNCQFGKLDQAAIDSVQKKLIQQPSRGQILPPDQVLVGRRHNRSQIQKSQVEAWLANLNQHATQAGPHIIRHLLISDNYIYRQRQLH